MFHCLVINVRCCFLVSSLFTLPHPYRIVKYFFQVFYKTRKRRRRDLNPRAAINDLLPFQGSPFGQLGYFSKLPYAIAPFFYQKRFILYRVVFVLSRTFLTFSKVFSQQAERVGFEPTRPCGQTVFKTASL